MARRPLPKRGRKPSRPVGEGARRSPKGEGVAGEGFGAKQHNPSLRLPPIKSGVATALPQGERGNRICVAQIGAAHGIRGELRLRSFTEDPMAVASYGILESEDGVQHFEIEATRPAKGHFVVRLAGVNDRNTAERLTNLKLYVPRDRLPPTEDADTFYHADLIGLAAMTQEGVALGKVTAIHHFGAGDLIEITPPDGGETLLVPFSDAAVPTVDIAGGRIVVAKF